MNKLTYYEKATGQIISISTMIDQDHLNSFIDTEFGAVEGEYDSTQYYFVNDVATSRPTMSCTLDKTTVTANGVDSITASNLPDPCEITITGGGAETKATVTGGSESITFDLAGAYTIAVKAFPYLPWEDTINAT
jgi:hypothetical protein